MAALWLQGQRCPDAPIAIKCCYLSDSALLSTEKRHLAQTWAQTVHSAILKFQIFVAFTALKQQRKSADSGGVQSARARWSFSDLTITFLGRATVTTFEGTFESTPASSRAPSKSTNVF